MVNHLGSFQLKTRILFGRGSSASTGQIAKELGASRFLLVTDPNLEDSPVIEPVQKSLLEAGLSGTVFSKLDSEPFLDNADDAADVGRTLEADLVIGVGGGSAMDTAKAAAVLITNEGNAERYVGLNMVEVPGVPTIMIPTTAGTGAEVTFTAVFINRRTSSKGGINSPFLFPEVALLDPELTVGLPPEVTAATGMDALTHAIESVTGRAASVFTEALAFTAIRLIANSLRRAVFKGNDLDARDNMLMGSLLGGLALADAGVGAAHALAYPLGGTYRVPHGLANAVLIPHVMEFNLPACERTMALVAQNMGESLEGLSPRMAAARAVDAVKILCSDIGIPASLAEVGVARADIPTLVEGAMKVARPIENNPRTLSKEDAAAIYQKAFG